MRSSLYEETSLEGKGDQEERELPAAATRKNDESSDNQLMEDIAIENRERDGNEILSMKGDVIEEYSKAQHTEFSDRQVLLKIGNSCIYSAMFDVANKALQIIYK